GIVHDMTEQQRSERRLRELQTELLHVSRLSEIGQMASALAHELNQPLAAIATFTAAAQLQLDHSDKAGARETMDHVAVQAVRAGQIIKRIRDFVSRGDTEKTEEQVSALVDEAVILAGAANRLGNIKIKRRFKPELPTVLVDKIQI